MSQEILLILQMSTAWKLSKYGVFSGPSFPIFRLNTGKYGPEETPYLNIIRTLVTGDLGLVWFFRAAALDLWFSISMCPFTSFSSCWLHFNALSHIMPRNLGRKLLYRDSAWMSSLKFPAKQNLDMPHCT